MKTKLIQLLADWNEKVYGTMQEITVKQLSKENVDIKLDGNILTVDIHSQTVTSRKVFFKLKKKVLFLEEELISKKLEDPCDLMDKVQVQ